MFEPAESVGRTRHRRPVDSALQSLAPGTRCRSEPRPTAAWHPGGSRRERQTVKKKRSSWQRRIAGAAVAAGLPGAALGHPRHGKNVRSDPQVRYEPPTRGRHSALDGRPPSSIPTIHISQRFEHRHGRCALPTETKMSRKRRAFRPCPVDKAHSMSADWVQQSPVDEHGPPDGHFSLAPVGPPGRLFLQRWVRPCGYQDPWQGFDYDRSERGGDFTLEMCRASPQFRFRTCRRSRTWTHPP